MVLSNSQARTWAGFLIDVKRLRNDSTKLRQEVYNRDTAITNRNTKINLQGEEIKNDTTVKNNYKNLLVKSNEKLDKKDKWNKVFKNISFTEFIIITVGVLLLILKVI